MQDNTTILSVSDISIFFSALNELTCEFIDEFVEVICDVFNKRMPSIDKKVSLSHAWSKKFMSARKCNVEKTVAHRYKLFTIMWQDHKERQFLECLKEIRVGHCSESS